MNREVVIYLDETSFNVWQIPSKMWRYSDDQDVPIQSKRGSSFTVIGAIDEFVGLRYYTVIKGSNNKEIFTEFMKNLNATLENRTAYIVLDNLPIHHSRVVKEAVQKMSNLQFIWLPPYSCSLNPIEKLWNLVKNKWRRQLVLHNKSEFQSDEKIVSILQSCVDNFPSSMIKRVFTASNRAMIDSLKGKFV